MLRRFAKMFFIQKMYLTPDDGGGAGGAGDNNSGGDGSSGTDGDDSGASGDGSSKDGYVPYTAHRRLLGEKKKAQELLASANARLAEIDAKAESDRKAALESQGKYKERLQEEIEKNKALSTDLNTFQTQQQNMFKLDSFLRSLDGNIDRAYWPMLEGVLEQITIDPETQAIDEMSVTEAVKFVKATYPAIISKPTGNTGLPTGAPRGSGQGQISYEEYVRMSNDKSVSLEKMREAYSNVKWD